MFALRQPVGVSLIAVLLLAGAALILFDLGELGSRFARSRTLVRACDGGELGPAPTESGGMVLDALEPSERPPQPTLPRRIEIPVPVPVPVPVPAPAPPPGRRKRGARRLAPSVTYPTWVPPKQVPARHQRDIYRYTHAHGDLPPLLPQLRPDRKVAVQWTKEKDWRTWEQREASIAICACMFQEHMEDVREWLLYHQCVSSPATAHKSAQV